MRTVQRSNLTRTTDVTTLEEQIRLRAYARYEARGREDGHELDDWLQADHDVLQPAADCPCCTEIGISNPTENQPVPSAKAKTRT